MHLKGYGTFHTCLIVGVCPIHSFTCKIIVGMIWEIQKWDSTPATHLSPTTNEGMAWNTIARPLADEFLFFQTAWLQFDWSVPVDHMLSQPNSGR